ncbi:MAG: AbrB/MazE/SpoVT family DNA-binding domain-containing protein [Lactobacillus sp.]|nr:AbrB/MazE/SpoVT family DNA-binding domain-containing protein [Lactobacillus sp.]
MTKALTGKMSQKNRVVVPATVRKKINLQKEMEVAFEAKDAFDWADLVKEIPNFVEKFMVLTYLNTTQNCKL